MAWLRQQPNAICRNAGLGDGGVTTANHPDTYGVANQLQAIEAVAWTAEHQAGPAIHITGKSLCPPCIANDQAIKLDARWARFFRDQHPQPVACCRCLRLRVSSAQRCIVRLARQQDIGTGVQSITHTNASAGSELHDDAIGNCQLRSVGSKRR